MDPALLPPLRLRGALRQDQKCQHVPNPLVQFLRAHLGGDRILGRALGQFRRVQMGTVLLI